VSAVERLGPGAGVPSAPVALVSGTRSGLGYWLRSLGLMMRFDFGRARTWGPMMAVIQLMMGAGMAMVYGFFYPHLSTMTALLIVSGTPTLALIPLGFVMVPGGISQQRLEGTFDFIWSLPAPRSAQVVSTFLLYSLLSLPGTVLALMAAAWRYGIHLEVTPVVVPAILVSAVVAVAVGFGMALAIRSPIALNLITNMLVFVVMLFSPIVFPPANLPGWLFEIHKVLPFYNMAVVIRAGLTQGLVTEVVRSYLVLLAWTAIGCGLTAWVVGRRP
jgi:ABC-2 type transport system permease protein